MGTWAKGLIVAGVVAALIVAVIPINLVPAVIGFALTVAGAIGWTRRVDGAVRRPPARSSEMVPPPSDPNRETLYVFGRTGEGTQRAMAEAARLADGRPVRLAVFVLEQARMGVPVDDETIAALRRYAESTAQTATIVSCVCRRPTDVTLLLPAESTVVIERVGPDWWPTFNQRLAKALKRSGCRVALA